MEGNYLSKFIIIDPDDDSNADAKDEAEYDEEEKEVRLTAWQELLAACLALILFHDGLQWCLWDKREEEEEEEEEEI